MNGPRTSAGRVVLVALAWLLLGFQLEAGAAAPGDGVKEMAERDALHKRIAGTTWTNQHDRIALDADGTIRHSDPQHSGTWGVVADRTIAVVLSNGWIDTWHFDEGVRTYSAVTYRRTERTYPVERAGAGGEAAQRGASKVTGQAALRERVPGSTWQAGLGLNRDGTITPPDPQYGGTWGVVGGGEPTIAVVFNHGFVDLWRLDDLALKGSATAYQRGDRTYQGKRTSGDNAAPEARAVLPAQSKREEALKLVKEVFADEYRGQSAEDRLALAARLLDQAGEAGNDDATRYVMLREARDIAAAGGDIGTALSAVDELVAAFEGTDAIALKLEALAAASRKVADAAGAAALVEAYIDLSGESLRREDLDRAIKVAGQADPIARKAKNPDLTARLSQRRKELRELGKQFGAGVGAAKQKLAADPNDPAANLTMGKFYGFAVGDWAKGLPMLAKGGDPALRKTATSDIAGVAAPPDAKAALGDAWWDISEKQAGLARRHTRGRAAHWYGQAVVDLQGLQRTRVEKRLTAIADEGKAEAGAAEPASEAARALERIVRKLPADAVPRKGQPWDQEKVGTWLSGQLKNEPFDAVLTLRVFDTGRVNGAERLSAGFALVGPVQRDGVRYTLAVSLSGEGPVPPQMLRAMKPGATVRVRGRVSIMSATWRGQSDEDIEGVDMYMSLKEPNLTLVRAAPATMKGGTGGLADEAGGKPAPAGGRGGGRRGGGAGGKAAVPKNVAAPGDGERLLDALARATPVEVEALLANSAARFELGNKLAKQFRDQRVELVMTVQAVIQDSTTRGKYVSLGLEPLGPVNLRGIEHRLSMFVFSEDPNHLADWPKLDPGMTVRIRGIIGNVHVQAWEPKQGPITTLTYQLNLQTGAVVTLAEKAGRVAR